MNGSPAEVGAGPMSADRVVGQAEYELDSTKRQLCNDGVSCQLCVLQRGLCAAAWLLDQAASTPSGLAAVGCGRHVD